jgi:hypothetical protein
MASTFEGGAAVRSRIIARFGWPLRFRPVLLFVGTIVALMAVACSSGEADSTPTPTLETPVPLVIPTSTPRPAVSLEDRRAIALVYGMFEFSTGPNLRVIRQMTELGHPGLVAPLIEITGLSFQDSTSEPIADALFQLTGENFGGSFEAQPQWFEWLIDHPEFEPIAGYDQWKGQFYSEIGRGLDTFLYENVPSRIPVWAIQFGGVGKDVIESLDEPIFTNADGATYLDPMERVFGIEVNGETKAYPERIMRVHELSNDVVGGRQVALVY